VDLVPVPSPTGDAQATGERGRHRLRGRHMGLRGAAGAARARLAAAAPARGRSRAQWSIDRRGGDRLGVGGATVIQLGAPSLNKRDGVVFVAGMATFAFDAGDEVGRRLAAVQLVTTDIASAVAVADGFGVSVETLWRWRRRFEVHGVGGLMAATAKTCRDVRVYALFTVIAADVSRLLRSLASSSEVLSTRIGWPIWSESVCSVSSNDLPRVISRHTYSSARSARCSKIDDSLLSDC